MQHFMINIDAVVDQAESVESDYQDPLEILINRELEILANRFGYETIDEFLFDNLDISIN